MARQKYLIGTVAAILTTHLPRTAAQCMFLVLPDTNCLLLLPISCESHRNCLTSHTGLRMLISLGAWLFPFLIRREHAYWYLIPTPPPTSTPLPNICPLFRNDTHHTWGVFVLPLLVSYIYVVNYWKVPVFLHEKGRWLMCREAKHRGKHRKGFGASGFANRLRVRGRGRGVGHNGSSQRVTFTRIWDVSADAPLRGPLSFSPCPY